MNYNIIKVVIGLACTSPLQAADQHAQNEDAAFQEAMRLSLMDSEKAEEKISIAEQKAIEQALKDSLKEEKKEFFSLDTDPEFQKACLLSFAQKEEDQEDDFGNDLELQEAFLLSFRQNQMNEEKSSFLNDVENDSEWEAALRLSREENQIEQKEEKKVKEKKEEKKALSVNSEIYEKAGKIIAEEYKKIEEEHKGYYQLNKAIDSHMGSMQDIVDAIGIDSYNHQLEQLQIRKARLYTIDIAPRLNALDKKQILVDNIPGLTPEEAEKILEDMGF